MPCQSPNEQQKEKETQVRCPTSDANVTGVRSFYPFFPAAKLVSLGFRFQVPFGELLRFIGSLRGNNAWDRNVRPTTRQVVPVAV